MCILEMEGICITIVIFYFLRLDVLCKYGFRLKFLTILIYLLVKIIKSWLAYNLQWDPKLYGNITKIRVPSSDIWIPGTKIAIFQICL